MTSVGHCHINFGSNLLSVHEGLMAYKTAQGSDTQNSQIGHLDHPMAHLYTDTVWLTGMNCRQANKDQQ